MVTRGLIQHIDRSRFDLHLCTVRPLHVEDDIEELGDAATYHPLDLDGEVTLRLRARALLGVASTVRSLRPDVLHVHSGTASYSMLAGLARRPRARVIEVHDAPQSQRLSDANLAVERVMGRRLRFRPLVHSSAVRTDLASAWSIDSADIPVVPLGVDSDRFARARAHRAEVRARLGLPTHHPLVVYVARLVPEKRPEQFVQVAAEVRRSHPEAVFALVGGGPETERVRAQVIQLGLDGAVVVPGFVDDLTSLYHAADVFLSTSRYEGFGLAIAEAMACGLPVVCTDVGGVRDAVGDAGILVAPDDEAGIARAVLELLEDPGRRRVLGEQGQARARTRLDVRATARSFEDAYRRALTDD